MAQQAQLVNFKQLVAMFLAEIIRSRQTSLGRAAEIAHRVISVLPQLKNENDALSTLTEIEKDFGEVTTLKQALHFGYQDSDIKVYEKEIKEYASIIFNKDMELSARFLEDASYPKVAIEELCLRYPDFCRYLMVSTSKAKFVQQSLVDKSR